MYIRLANRIFAKLVKLIKLGYCLCYYLVTLPLYGKNYPLNYISPTASVRNHGNVFLGKKFELHHGSTLWGSSFKAGGNVHINPGSHIRGPVYIGDNVMIAPNVTIAAGNHGIKLCDIPMYYQATWNTKPIIIEDDVWIGANSVILSNVTIGSGAVIGAGSIVTHSVEPNAIVVGNPARLLRYRSEDDSGGKRHV